MKENLDKIILELESKLLDLEKEERELRNLRDRLNKQFEETTIKIQNLDKNRQKTQFCLYNLKDLFNGN